jgi:hypothetical protein
MHVVYNAVSIQTGCRIDSTVASKTRVSPRCVGATTAAVREHQCSNVFVGVTCVHSNTTTVHPRDDWSCTKACTAIETLLDTDTGASPFHDGWVGNTPTSRVRLAREVLRNRSRRHSSQAKMCARQTRAHHSVYSVRIMILLYFHSLTHVITHSLSRIE